MGPTGCVGPASPGWVPASSLPRLCKAPSQADWVDTACPQHAPSCPLGTGVHSCCTSGALGPEDGPWGLQLPLSEARCPQVPGLSPPHPLCSVPAQPEQGGGALATAAQDAGLAPVPPSLGPDFQCLCLLSWS